MITQSHLDALSYKVIGAAIEVHKTLGPGLLESVYHRCLFAEFIERNIQFTSQHIVPIEYKGIHIEAELRCDFFIEQLIAVEIKAIDAFAPIHEAQLLTYMKLLKAPKGILINFNCINIFKEGQKTFVNEMYAALPK
ncbi:MAG TPA: GxxExxY protein [Flavipsychrobacter sp.]|nr:GxxExxY protein [Flavipsychrobacter sp.]